MFKVAKRGRRGGLPPPTGAAGGTLAARELLRVLLAVWPECTRCFLFRRWGHLASQADMEMGCFEPLSGGGGAGGSSGSLSGSVDGGGSRQRRAIAARRMLWWRAAVK